MLYSQVHPSASARPTGQMVVSLPADRRNLRTQRRPRSKPRRVTPQLALSLATLLAMGAITGLSSRDELGSGSGTIHVTARVVDINAAESAAGRLSELAHELEKQLRVQRQALQDTESINTWIESLQTEQNVGGGTVQFEYIPPTSNEPATLQVEWTSN